MNNYQLILPNEIVEVNIEKTTTNHKSLTIYPDKRIKLVSDNKNNDDSDITYIKSKKKWIEKTLRVFKSIPEHPIFSSSNNGMSLKLLGIDFRVYYLLGKSKYEMFDKKINIYLNDINNKELRIKRIREFFRAKSIEVITERVNLYFDKIFRSYDLVIPQIKIKRMRRFWGKYNKEKNTITINEYIVKASRYLIDYVVLHELTHQLYIKHNSDFYSFLTIHMPDWRERKKILDYEISQGI